MIVLGGDTHKRSHTIAAVDSATGELFGEKTIGVGVRGFAALLIWARDLEGERVWALEDCRHVAGSLERFLIARGERELRIPTRLTAGTRRAGASAGSATRSTRSPSPGPRWGGNRGVADGGVGRAGARPATAGRSPRASRQDAGGVEQHDAVASPRPLARAHVAGRRLFSQPWTTRIARRLARAEQTMRVRIARDELRRLRGLTTTIKALEAEITGLATAIAPHWSPSRASAR